MKHKMILVEGNQATNRRKFSYRGHFIWSQVRSHDFRNKSHPGYNWSVEMADGQKILIGISGMKGAKNAIDQRVK